MSRALVSALPAAFCEWRTAEALRNLERQLGALKDQVGQAARAAEDADAAEAARGAAEAADAARLQAQAAQIDAAAAHNEGVELFEMIMAVADYRDCLCDQLDTALLSKIRVSRAMKSWIDPILAGRGVAAVDVAAGIRVIVLHLCVMENRVVRMARGEYKLEGGGRNEEHAGPRLFGVLFASGAQASGRWRSQRASRSSGRRVSCFRAHRPVWQ